MPSTPPLDRRKFLQAGLASIAMVLSARKLLAASGYKLNYLVASSVYGSLPLREILPEVRRHGSTVIDLWPRRHGTQREEADQLGLPALKALLAEHGVSVAATTRFDLGPFALGDEFKFLGAVGAKFVVTGAKGPTKLTGGELKAAVATFVRDLEPTLVAAERAGITVAIENHGNSLIDSPDSLRWLADLTKGRPLGIAFAPYHLPQDESLLAQLIRDLSGRISLFYGWQHGDGAMEPMPREREHLQMPGRGPLDFTPLLRALRDTQFNGWTEVFMHPTPRGIPIMDTSAQVTDELNRGRDYLNACLARLPA